MNSKVKYLIKNDYQKNKYNPNNNEHLRECLKCGSDEVYIDRDLVIGYREEYEYDGEDCVYSDHDIFCEDFVTRDDVRCQKCGYENSWKIFDGKPFTITLSVRS